MSTSDDQRFIRFWYEIDINKFKPCGGDKWIPLNKGGGGRKWFGNNIFVINWEDDGKEIKLFAKELYGSVTRTIKNMGYYFKSVLTWGRVSGNNPTFRYFPSGFIFTDIGCCLFADKECELFNALGFLNSEYGKRYLKLQSKNVKVETGHVKSLPYSSDIQVGSDVNKLIEIFKKDWNEYELL